MSDDPYADLPNVTTPAQAKRPREEGDEPRQPVPKRVTVEPTPSPPSPKPAAKPALDLFQTIDKIKGYMMVDKKFAKASVLFGKLLVEECSVRSPSEDVMTALLDAIKGVMEAKADRIHHVDARNEFKALMMLVDSHRVALLEAPEYEADTIDNWVLDAVLHNDLFTDDTYRFAKATKALATHLDRRDEGVDSKNDGDVDALDKVLFPCLRTLMARHATSWAKTSVELVMHRLTATRLKFPEAYRNEIDLWTQTIHQRKHAPVDKISAAAEMRKNIIIYNETQTGNKVGRVNHPLHNIN
ncbi:hypothetical protein SPRG_03340 [Saprolegnia parasitica CBS 223.65]|uniref:Uncharacterized protein n=1 Tax=Saprolegnia parasitica (strain CBS 223.65) TaxID=695850 RepID=A0A067CNP7_SAPPC|nr:hypothetical protein SPRG_03340 [Saprolegnia parasitica CBS 223.65]KDO32123.1 hypothetical protein SPRG_03340 [Saprolegnia parasitica CBS 223.65]|eukprot:XP_012197307.1 hypothetical protein SPRG_03340 [Saprolegnia parasitica CBS 223.65]